MPPTPAASHRKCVYVRDSGRSSRYVKEHRAGWTVLHGETTSPTDAQVAREVAELRGRIIVMLTTLFDDEAFAHAFTGAAESLATWWVNQPQPSIDEGTEILMRIAEAATGWR